MNLLFSLLGLVQKGTATAAIVQFEAFAHLTDRDRGTGGTQRPA